MNFSVGDVVFTIIICSFFRVRNISFFFSLGNREYS